MTQVINYESICRYRYYYPPQWTY